jgi:hypothetical protein
LDVTPSRVVSDGELLQTYQEQDGNALKTGELVGLSASQVRKRIARIRLAGGSHNPTVFERSKPEVTNRLQELIDNSSVNVESIGSIKHIDISEWGGGIKNKDGEWEEHGLYKKAIRFVAPSPAFPLVQPATPTTIVYSEAPRIMRKVHQGVVVSDAQIGYLRDIETGLLDTIHDPRAMEVCRQFIGAVQPEFLGFIGDWVDFSWVSRWQKRPEFFGIAQPSIQAGYEWKARYVAAAPADARKIEIGSNHAIRPDIFILEYNRESLGLTRAKRPGDTTEWPVFSEQFLLRYDELGIEFSGQYPGGEFYVLDNLVLMHAPPKSKEFDASVIHGHTHKLGNASSHVVQGSFGRREHITYDTGCLCRTDATTSKRRLVITSVPSDRARTNWLQGIIHFEWMDWGAETKHQVHPIHIFDGTALYQGQAFSAPVDFDEAIVPKYGYAS